MQLYEKRTKALRGKRMHEGKYKYQITKEKLMDYIQNLSYDTPLPNRNVLAKQCGVARVTLERAISELIGEGILVSEDGKGTYVTKKEVELEKKAKSEKGKAFWAILMYSVLDGMNPGIIRGVEDFANKTGRYLLVCNTDNDPRKETEYLKGLLRQNIEGIILIPNTHSVVDADVLDLLAKKDIRVVACGRQVPGYDFPGAFQNFFMTGFIAAQHLLEVGCRNIAYLADSQFSTIEARLQGYLTALEQYNYQNPDDKIKEVNLGLSDLRGDIEKKFESFLKEHSEIDGIYVFTDRLAMILYKVMKKMDLVPGKNICVISGDSSNYGTAFSVPLSTVDCPAYKMGWLAAEQLLKDIRGSVDPQNKHILLGCELNARESTLGYLSE